MAQPKSKPLSFGTTLRNPERIIHFLRIIKNYESKILDNNLIFEILEDIIINKLYKPTFIGQNDFYNKIYESDQLFTKKEAKEIINNSIQNHKEYGFDYGWPSRFDTFYKLIMEFGYCYYAMNKPIEISELGNILIKSYNEDDNENIMSCFLNSMVKFQTASPFKKNEHKNIPLVLLLKVINLLKEKGYTNGIYRKEISLFICWPNNNPKELCEYIINFRNKYNYNYSDTLIYEKCLEFF